MPTARRRFLRSLAAVPLLPAALARAQSPAPPSPAPPAAVPSPAPSASPSPGEMRPGPVADALGEAVRHRFSGQLEASDLDEVKRVIERNLRSAEALKTRMKLTNADEPVTTFTPRLPSAPSAAAPQRRGRR